MLPLVKVLDLLTQLMSVPYLKERLVLKGGTAINLFCGNHSARLSVDLDFNYIGSSNRDAMQQERELVETLSSSAQFSL